jgi:hypothetical protein
MLLFFFFCILINVHFVCSIILVFATILLLAPLVQPSLLLYCSLNKVTFDSIFYCFSEYKFLLSFFSDM